MPRKWILIFPLLLSALHSRAVAEVKSPWTEVRSPHFTIYTDAGEKRGRDIALRFEQMRSIFASLTGERELRTAPALKIVVFRNQKELQQVLAHKKGRTDESTIGLTLSGDYGTIIAFGLGIDDAWQTALHEFAHMLLHTNFPPTQLWFDEGFAEYYSTIQVGDKEVVIGTEPNPYVTGTILREKAWPGAVELFSVNHKSAAYQQPGPPRDQFYAHSWVAVHYLFDTRKLAEAAKYFSLVNDRQVAIPDAIRQAFGESPQDLDGDIRSYVLGTKFKFLKAPLSVGIKAASFSAAPVDEWKAAAVIARLHSISSEYLNQSIGEFQEVLQHDPGSADALSGLGLAYFLEKDYVKADETLRKEMSLQDGDPYAHYYWALVIAAKSPASTADRAQLAEQAGSAVNVDPSNADAYFLLGKARMNLDQIVDAYKAMNAAVQLAPAEERYSLGLAEVLLRGKRGDLAGPLLARLAKSSNKEIADQARKLQEGSAGTPQQPSAAPAPKSAPTPPSSH
jgi:tetratricopeptide (TPR) repeat protein